MLIGSVFLSMLLFIMVFFGIINKIKQIKRDYPDDWKIYLVGFHILNLVVSIMSYFFFSNYIK